MWAQLWAVPAVLVETKLNRMGLNLFSSSLPQKNYQKSAVKWVELVSFAHCLFLLSKYSFVVAIE